MEAAKRGSETSTLGDLSVYLLLSQASSKYGVLMCLWNPVPWIVAESKAEYWSFVTGFDYEEEGLTAEEAGNIAALFARFDLNDDGK